MRRPEAAARPRYWCGRPHSPKARVHYPNVDSEIASKRRAHALPVVGPPLGGRPKPQTIAAPLNLVPRSHTFQELSPSPADSDRPLRRRLPANGRLPRKAARDAADLRTFSCKQIWPKAIKSTSSDIARRRQKRRCKTESRLQDTKPGQEPLPSEYILRGRHIDRSVRRRPAYSLTPRQAERLAIRQSEAGTAAAAGGRAEATSHRPFLVNPDPRTVHPSAHSEPTQQQERRSPFSSRLPTQLHPPYSRKGPVLGGTSLKSLRGVKSEVTISRFRVFVDSAKFHPSSVHNITSCTIAVGNDCLAGVGLNGGLQPDPRRRIRKTTAGSVLFVTWPGPVPRSGSVCVFNRTSRAARQASWVWNGGGSVGPLSNETDGHGRVCNPADTMGEGAGCG
jgi:hypothetical protein